MSSRQSLLDAAFSGPATLANKVAVSPAPGGVRLTFLEVGIDGITPPAFRAAVFLQYSDLAALADLMRTTLDGLGTVPSEANNIMTDALKAAEKL